VRSVSSRRWTGWTIGKANTADNLATGLVDLDQPLKVLLNGKAVFEGKVPRQADAILKSLQQRADPRSAATALLEVREK